MIRATAATALLSATIVALALPSPCALSAQQQTRTGGEQAPTIILHGRILDAATGRALAGAELVAITASDTLRARSDAKSEWQLAVDAAQPYTIRARMLGYAPRARSSIIAGGAGKAAGTSLDVRLTPVPVSIDAVVTTAARGEQRLADAVVTTEIISHSDIERSGSSDVAGALLEHTGIQVAHAIFRSSPSSI
jgi:hypothetical protein